MVDETRAEIMAKKTNQSVAVCRGIVANERKSLELDKRAQKANSEDKMEADVKAFVEAYPELSRDPNNIPQEVWDQVHNGESLVNAYRAYENKQLKAQLEKERSANERRVQEEKNKARSTGSQSTQGKKEIDPFDALWYDGN